MGQVRAVGSDSYSYDCWSYLITIHPVFKAILKLVLTGFLFIYFQFCSNHSTGRKSKRPKRYSQELIATNLQNVHCKYKQYQTHGVSRPCCGPASLTLFLPTLQAKGVFSPFPPDCEYFVPSHFDIMLFSLFYHYISPDLSSVDCHSLILIADSPHSDKIHFALSFKLLLFHFEFGSLPICKPLQVQYLRKGISASQLKPTAP